MIKLQYDYAIITSRYRLNETVFPEQEIVYTIERQGAVFSVVKK